MRIDSSFGILSCVDKHWQQNMNMRLSQHETAIHEGDCVHLNIQTGTFAVRNTCAVHWFTRADTVGAVPCDASVMHTAEAKDAPR